MSVRGAALRKEPLRGTSLHGALVRLEERFGVGAVLDGRRAEEHLAVRRIPLGLPSLDALLDGGLVAGEPLLLVGAPTSGALTLALQAAAAAQARGGDVAWLDPTRSFDPLAAARVGVDLDRLLLLRVDGEELAFAATVVARSAAFALLVVDLGLSFARAASTDALGPVVAQARASGVSLLVLGDASAHIALPSLEVRQVEWLRRAGRIVGWRAEVARRHRSSETAFSFAPLALPPVAFAEEGMCGGLALPEAAG